MNYKTKEWKILTQINNAHNDGISSLCEISNKRLISSSYDKTIKIWNVSSNTEKTLIKTLTQRGGEIYQVITLTNNRFTSCSYTNGTVKLWNSEKYEQISIPFEQQLKPNSLLQLRRQREVLIINSLSPALRFYQLCHPYELLGIVNDVCTNYRYGLIELSNGHVAASYRDIKCIYIVDPKKYELVTTIVDEEYILDCGSLYAFSKDSFIHAPYDGEWRI